LHPPYSYYNPMTGTPPLAIDPVTGIITCTPTWLGRYLVTVCCNEWRNGIMINTIHREFQFVVTDCAKNVVADLPSLPNDPATFTLNCANYTVNFVNTSIGGTTWFWDFGVPGAAGDTSTLFQPTFTYPDSGTYKVKLVVNPGTHCADSIVKLVKIYPPFNAQFADSGSLCPGSQIGFLDRSDSSRSPVVNWLWAFGDGDTTMLQNNIHSYKTSGAYFVTLIAQNSKNCTDTFTRQLVIDDFIPLAGNDTIIIKGQSIQFNATGGTQYYWEPANNLSNPAIGNPIGSYPDTGQFRYLINIVSASGCKALDTLQVIVVSQPEFFVPTAFSPNGDGKNDVLIPFAVGYKSLHYFKIFDRLGEVVYTGQNFETGWDGTFKGTKAETGTYFWEIRYVDALGNDGIKKGDVTLVR